MVRYVRVDYGHGFERLEVYHTHDIEKDTKFNFKFNEEFKTDEEEIERISLSRTKRNIRELALCNDFEYFITITLDRKSCSREILTDCQELLKKNLKKYKRKNSSFGYLIITEKHKKGGFHFHGFVKGIDISNLIRYTEDDFDLSKGNELPYKLIRSIQRGDVIYHFDLFDSNIGYNTLSPIRDYVACCTYIQKYITKDCIRNEHNQIYISSRGLKKAKREELMPFDIEKFDYKKLNKTKNQITSALYQNDYVKYIDLFPDKDLNHNQKRDYCFDIIPRKEFFKTHIDF